MKDLLSPGDIVHPEKLREIHEGVGPYKAEHSTCYKRSRLSCRASSDGESHFMLLVEMRKSFMIEVPFESRG